MSALTWRQVSAPDFSGSASLYKTAAEQLDKATSGMSAGLKDWQGARMSRAEDQIAQQASQYDSPEAYRAALASGQILSGVDQGLIGKKLIEAAAGQESAIAAREKQGAQYAAPEVENLLKQALIARNEPAITALTQQHAKTLRLTNSEFADPLKVRGMVNNSRVGDVERTIQNAMLNGDKPLVDSLINNPEIAQLLRDTKSKFADPLSVDDMFYGRSVLDSKKRVGSLVSQIDNLVLSGNSDAARNMRNNPEVADALIKAGHPYADTRNFENSLAGDAFARLENDVANTSLDINKLEKVKAAMTAASGNPAVQSRIAQKFGSMLTPSFELSAALQSGMQPPTLDKTDVGAASQATAALSAATKTTGGSRITADTLSDSKGKLLPPAVSAIAHEIGLSGTELKIHASITGQESGDNAKIGNSIDGARGPGQVMPDTFKRYALPGERIDDPADNIRVSQRIIKDLSKKTGGDPARIAVGYFSGEGNIAPAGSPTPWKKNKQDGNKKKVSSYVADVVKRHSADKNTYTPTPLIPTKQETVDNAIVAQAGQANKSRQINAFDAAGYASPEVDSIANNDTMSAHALFKKASGNISTDNFTERDFINSYKKYGWVETPASKDARKKDPKLAPVKERLPIGRYAIALAKSTEDSPSFGSQRNEALNGGFFNQLTGAFRSNVFFANKEELARQVEIAGGIDSDVTANNAKAADELAKASATTPEKLNAAASELEKARLLYSVSPTKEYAKLVETLTTNYEDLKKRSNDKSVSRTADAKSR